ncbi:MAG: hypothetical protein KGD63_07720 [Candidatus Lokiarchaeota archaeon]|nr:hypothetical protein [Candidatus Lokiarchaeota archaeon]
MNDNSPPICYICKKNFKKSIHSLYYCICDISVCEDCIVSIKNNKTEWSCPKCGEINNIEGSKLLRDNNLL